MPSLRWFLYYWRRGRINIKLWAAKVVINLIVRLGLRVIPEAQITRPASAMLAELEPVILKSVWIENAYRKPTDQDLNFFRLIAFTFKAARWLTERDPAYELWVGYLFKRAHLQYEDSLEVWRKQLESQGEALSEQYPEAVKQLFDPAFIARSHDQRLYGGLYFVEEKLN